ncbi:MAG TPA: phosphoribosyl-AMP cyclohydrolase [Thermoleophilia bacterium]|nr:phosphoribosyl-AMP cyclohydrolase [Thermoleophilia bacterium]
MDHTSFLDTVRYDANGLVPCVVQDKQTGEVLMVAWANAEAMSETLRTAEAHFWSRSRKVLWHKGGSSGNVQGVLSASLDCDHDTVLLAVEPAGPACHTGAVSCFREMANGGATVELQPTGA